jgi:hypothetical protein
LFGTSSTGSSDTSLGDFYFSSADKIGFYQFSGGIAYSDILSTQVFRDPSAWYHIVLAYDDTQATAANRVKIYVNGVQITAFGTASYPTQNFTSFFNGAQPHAIGRYAGAGSGSYYDGYLAETYFIDGQALTPSSLGSTNALTGVWQPAPYTGSYGTNGFYLPYTDNSALTTSSNVGLGQDFSGNANYWTTNNISITAGVTYDSMTDVPTLTNATTANYCVMNPLTKAPNSTLVDGNLLVGNTTASIENIRATMTTCATLSYWEYVATTVSSSIRIHFGGILSANAQSVANTVDLGLTGPTGTFAGVFDSGMKFYVNGAQVGGTYGSTTLTGLEIIMFAHDSSTGKVWMGLGGVWFNSGNPAAGTGQVATLTAGTVFPAVMVNGSAGNNRVTANFGQSPFAYTPPSGFVALNTFNLPASTIVKGNVQMDATLYTGTGASLAVTNAAGFQPDLVWMKGRSGATDHAWYDSVRGVQNQLESNTTTAETAEATGLTAFGSGGFTIGALAQVNTSAATYVGWQWKGGGAAVSNTAGTITSQVSANASAGFSIATFFGTSANATVGHGLGVAPKFIVVKNRSSGAWYSYHVSSGAGNYLVLNANSANAADTTAWNNTAPSSSVFYLGSNVVINPAATCIAYCWAEIDGFSKFGSYTGNGSTDGPFVYTGFRPRWLMIKRTDSTSNWYIFDTARNTFNVMTDELLANSSNAEANNNRWIDCLSNGFKIRNDAASQINASGGTMVYAAFAENPFKNSLAR